MHFSPYSLERAARYLAGIFALLAILVLLCFKTGLIASEASYYKDDGWYARSERFGMSVMSEFSSRTECEHAFNADRHACRPGKELRQSLPSREQAVSLFK